MKPSSLIPADDLLLNTSIEAEASEEAFAEGNKKNPDKREGGSICMPYYRTRRRIKYESFNSLDLSFFDRCNNFQDHVTLDHEAQVGDVMFRDCPADNLGSIAATDLIDKSADRCHRLVQNGYGSMREDASYKLAKNVCPLLRENLMDFCDPGIVPKDDTLMHKGESDDYSAVTEVECASLPDSLLSFSDKDYIVCNLNTEDTVDDIPNSQLLDSPENVLEDPSLHGDEQDFCHWEDDVESTSISHLDSIQLCEGKIICNLNTEDPEIPCNDNISLLIHPSPSVKSQIASNSIDIASSFSRSQMYGSDLSSELDSKHPHVGNTLISVSVDLYPSISDHNSDSDLPCFPDVEDPDIPCNDDKLLLIHQPPSVRPQTATVSIEPVKSFTQSLMDGQDLSSEFDYAHQHVGSILKSVSVDHYPSISDHNCNNDLHCFTDIEDPDISFSVRLQTATESIGPAASFTRSQLDEPHLSSEFGYAHPHVGSTLKSVSVDHNPSVSDFNNSDHDIDPPCFPDIEALILKLDFEYVQDSWITNEGKRRKYKHTKTTINRLEQSLSQRTMSSLGAFAVFFSRHSNYYIKKTEVIIGRSTDDTEVDIDLRKEIHANMISRQQAIIKMETNGTFTLKNIGKGSILVKGISIAHGQVAALGSSCLIQMKGMDFMFEINDKHVRWYLDNIIKKTQGKYRTFEWSVTCG